MPVRNITLGSRLRSKVRTIRKITTKDNGKAAITVDPKDPKTRFYTKVEKNQFNLASKITHMTPEVHRILKENPALPEFILNNKSGKLETNNGIFTLSELNKKGYRNYFSCEYYSKISKTAKRYFIKKQLSSSSWANAEAEFLAVREMEKLGLNVIKPQFAISDIKHTTPQIIVYDCVDLKTFGWHINNGSLTKPEMYGIERKIEKLKQNKKLQKLKDFDNLENIFVERLPNGKLKLYFTDIYWEENAYKRKREEYL